MEKQKKFSAILVEENKQTKGNIYISNKTIIFIDNNKNEYFSQLEWSSLRYQVNRERISVLLFIKQIRPLFILSDSKGHKFSFIADQVDYINYSEITSVLDYFIKFAKKREKIDKKQIDEIHREQEKIYLETERREQEHPLEESTNDKQEKHELAVAISNIKMEQEKILMTILELYKSKDAEIAISCGASVVFDFWINAFNSENIYSYLVDDSNSYDEVISFLNNFSSDKMIIYRFENIVEEIYEVVDCVLTDYEEEISDFLISVCKSVYPHYQYEFDASLDYIDLNEICKWADVAKYRDRAEDNFQKDIITEKEEKKRERAKEYKRQYELALAYVQIQRVPFTNRDVLQNVPTLTKSVVQDVFVREEKILNFYKKYIWYDNLNISSKDEMYICQKVQDIVSDFDSHHISELYDIIQYENPELLNKYMLTTPHRLFSVVKYICRKLISTDRPYIARYGVKVKNAQERLNMYIRDKDLLSVRSLIEYAEENYMQIGNIIHTINGLNGTHLMLDKHNLFKIKTNRISADVAKKVENIIFSEVNERHAIGICELTCSSRLPDVGIKWNEWLIYSILKKWSTRLFVDTVGTNYKNAIPIISVDSYVFDSEKEKIEARCSGMTLGSVLDITDVDAVLEDALEDILEDLEI